MSSVDYKIVCTLAEGNLHFGLAALTNSLIASGFRGRICAAYRKDLPTWRQDWVKVSTSNGEYSSARLTENVELSLIRFAPPGHAGNFKPHFIDYVANSLFPSAQDIYFFDPDIIVECDWMFFDAWIEMGVALAEDVTPPMPEHHPKRVAWRKIFGRHGLSLRYRSAQYANGGFVGLRRKHIEFVNVWKRTTAIMGLNIGGLDVASLPGGRVNKESRKYGMPFDKTDQDALNAAVEAFDDVVVILGCEVMGFEPGGHVMTHALGREKPWTKPFIRRALQGHPPSRADLAFWRFASGPIRPFRQWTIRRSLVRLSIARLIGRFYQSYI